MTRWNLPARIRGGVNSWATTVASSRRHTVAQLPLTLSPGSRSPSRRCLRVRNASARVAGIHRDRAFERRLTESTEVLRGFRDVLAEEADHDLACNPHPEARNRLAGGYEAGGGACTAPAGLPPISMSKKTLSVTSGSASTVETATSTRAATKSAERSIFLLGAAGDGESACDQRRWQHKLFYYMIVLNMRFCGAVGQQESL